MTDERLYRLFQILRPIYLITGLYKYFVDIYFLSKDDSHSESHNMLTAL